MDQKKKRGAGGGGVDDKAALIARNRAALQKRKDAAAAAKVAVGFELNPGPDQASLSTKTFTLVNDRHGSQLQLRQRPKARLLHLQLHLPRHLLLLQTSAVPHPPVEPTVTVRTACF